MDQIAPRMKDFWLSCGHHLLDRDAGGGLVATDEFLKAYLARPELAPPPDACVVEKTLHAALLADPRRPVDAADIEAIADADARENWELMLGFRDHLLAHPTLEAAYLALMRHGAGRTPPLFVNQLVHVILRNILDGCEDAFVLRAAELFFRPQRITLHEGAVLAGDEERIAGSNPAPLSPLVSLLGLEKSAAIDVCSFRSQRGGVFRAQRRLRHGDRPDRRTARAVGARRRDRALGPSPAGDRGRGRAADRAAQRAAHLVCRARCRRHADRRSPVARRHARPGEVT